MDTQINIDELLSTIEVATIEEKNPSIKEILSSLISLNTQVVKFRVEVTKNVCDSDCVIIYDCEKNKYFCFISVKRSYDLISNLDEEKSFGFSDFKNTFSSSTIPICCLNFTCLYIYVPLDDVPTQSTTINYSYDGYILSQELRVKLMNSNIINSDNLLFGSGCFLGIKK